MKPSSLLKPYTLVSAQALNSFSDHVCKIVASGLVAATMPEHQAAVWVGIVSFLYIVPYIVLAPFFGKLTQRWSKASLVRFSYGLQLGATAVIGVGAWVESFGLLLVGLAGVAFQSGILSPARNALMKILVGSKRIGQFMGLLELAGISATLAGLALGGWSFDRLWEWAGSPWNAAAYAAVGSLLTASVALVSVFWIRSENDVLDEKSVSFREVVSEIVSRPAMRWTVLGLSWFYGAGVMIVMILLQHGRWEHGQAIGAASDGGMLAAVLGVGAALGSGVAAYFCRKRIEVGLSFLGAIGMMIFLPLTALFWHDGALAYVGIFASGFMAGLFSAPLNGLFVALSRDDASAATLAAGNLFMNVACAGFVGLQVFLSRVLEWGPESQLMVMASLSVFVVVWMSYLVPESLVRVLLLAAVKVIYPTKIRNAQRLPEKGGALMISNHVTFADAAILYAAANRPVRFIAGPSSFRFPFIKWAYKRFNVINISSGKAREAISKTVAALKEGEVVCIFPEGRLTRTGTMYPFKRGAELIARMARVPVVPAYLDGMWGSIFSYADKPFRFRSGMPLRRKISVRFGEAIAFDEASIEVLRDGVMELGFEAISERESVNQSLGYAALKALKTRSDRVRLIDRGEERKAYTGLQIGVASLLLAGRLKKETHRPRVGILLPPGFGGTVANLAASFSKRSALNLNPTVSSESIADMLSSAGIDTLITSMRLLRRFPDLDVGSLKLLFIEDAFKRFTAWEKWKKAAMFKLCGVERIASVEGISRDGGEIEAALLFSSGSAAQPKGIPLSHRNVLGNALQLTESRLMDCNDRILGNLPLFHSFGYTGGIWLPLLKGMTVVTTPSPLEARRNVSAIRDESVSVLLGTPTFLKPYMRKANREDFASVRFTVAGAEKTPAWLSEEWERCFGSPILEGYGLTECSPVVSANCLHSDESVMEGDEGFHGMAVGTAGRSLPGVWIRIVNPENLDELRRDGESGLVLLKGVNVFRGYLNAAGDAERFHGDGWFNTGDIGSLDVDGFLRIEGRLIRFSKIGGEMVPHGGVEEAIGRAFPELAQSSGPAFVVGARDSVRKGEELVLLTRAKVSLRELRQRLRKMGIPNLWIPQAIREVGEIPCLASGKLDLKQCVAMCRGEGETIGIGRELASVD